MGWDDGESILEMGWEFRYIIVLLQKRLHAREEKLPKLLPHVLLFVGKILPLASSFEKKDREIMGKIKKKAIKTKSTWICLENSWLQENHRSLEKIYYVQINLLQSLISVDDSIGFKSQRSRIKH